MFINKTVVTEMEMNQRIEVKLYRCRKCLGVFALTEHEHEHRQQIPLGILDQCMHYEVEELFL